MLSFCLSNLCGCVTSPNRQQIERDKINEMVLKNADNAAADARAAKLHFLDCVKEYAIKNSQASVTATELAEAAVSNCELDLMNYQSMRKMYHSSMGRLTLQSLDEFQRNEDKAQYKATAERQELSESGKGLAINTLIDTRK